jgi:restriction system protein
MAPRYGLKWDEIELDEWLEAINAGNDDLIVDFCFPNKRIKEQYIDSVTARNEDEVRSLLRHFLIPTGEFGSDALNAEFAKRAFDNEPEMFGRLMAIEYYRRLVGADVLVEPTWQGLSWVLDLLPRWPMQALEVLEAYLLAHMMYLPDGRISGIADAQAVIRAMWIGNPASSGLKRDLLLQLGPVRFEHLVEALYHAMEFDTAITPPSRDGGRDIKVSRETPGAREQSLVECKLWSGPVGVQKVRQLLGVVAHELATKGVLVTTGSFTKPARDLAASDPRLELISWQELLALLDQHLGADWGRDVDWLVTSSMRRAGLSE